MTDDAVHYTGDVQPGGGPDVRELSHLTITKVAVDPLFQFDPNATLARRRVLGRTFA